MSAREVFRVEVRECDTCATVARCVLSDVTGPACAPCLRACFDHAWAHLRPEIEASPGEWVSAFRAMGEPLPAALAACYVLRSPVFGGWHECQNCGTHAGGVWHKFPGADGSPLWACPACRADVRRYARTERNYSRALNRRARGRDRLREFRAQAKARAAWVRFVTMHAACSALGGAL